MTPIAIASRVVEKSRIVMSTKPRRVEQWITSFLIARLGEGKIMKLKKIILGYSFIPLFESFCGGKEKFISLFESLTRREWN